MAQTSYQINMDAAAPGFKVDLSDDFIMSLAAEGEIEFGIGLDEGTDGEKQCIPYDGTTQFLGVSIHTHKEDGVYNDEETVAIGQRVRVWVKLVAAMTIAPGDPVYCKKDAGADQGYFRNTVDASADLIAGAVFVGTKITRDSEDIAAVDINRP